MIPPQLPSKGKFLLFGLISVGLFSSLIIFLLTLGKNKPSEELRKQPTTQTKLQSTDSAALKGVSLSPKSFDSVDFVDFFDKAEQLGTVVTWAGDWFELEKEKNAAQNIMDLTKKFSYEPVIIIGVYNQGAKSLTRPLNEENLSEYKNLAVEFVKKYQPKFLGLGGEVNIMFENHPQEFEKFVKLFDDTYSLVKQVAPKTQIFTTFQLERIKGLKGGLFGGLNDYSKHNWGLLDKFNKADFLAFTTYPYLIYKNPSEIPDNYYEDISNKTTKEIAFVELGWPSATIAKSWESSEKEQAEFIDTFLEKSKNLNKVMVIWPFVYDSNFGQTFKGLGLITQEGKEKTSFEKWKAAEID